MRLPYLLPLPFYLSKPILRFGNLPIWRERVLQPKVHQGLLKSEGFRFAVVVSRWNDFLTAKLLEGALDALERLGADEKSIGVFKVPGSFEIPLTAQKIAESGKFDAIICLGVVIRGQTPHFDYVAGEAAKGIGQVGMKTGVPVMFGVVTAETLEQAIDRCGVKAGNKGFEAAMAAVELVNLYQTMGGESKAKGKG
jgi:6,7-dimethyl-8-ribityllumazine synthase